MRLLLDNVGIQNAALAADGAASHASQVVHLINMICASIFAKDLVFRSNEPEEMRSTTRQAIGVIEDKCFYKVKDENKPLKWEPSLYRDSMEFRLLNKVLPDHFDSYQEHAHAVPRNQDRVTWVRDLMVNYAEALEHFCQDSGLDTSFWTEFKKHNPRGTLVADLLEEGIIERNTLARITPASGWSVSEVSALDGILRPAYHGLIANMVGCNAPFPEHNRGVFFQRLCAGYFETSGLSTGSLFSLPTDSAGRNDIRATVSMAGAWFPQVANYLVVAGGGSLVKTCTLAHDLRYNLRAFRSDLSKSMKGTSLISLDAAFTGLCQQYWSLVESSFGERIPSYGKWGLKMIRYGLMFAPVPSAIEKLVDAGVSLLDDLAPKNLALAKQNHAKQAFGEIVRVDNSTYDHAFRENFSKLLRECGLR